MIVYHQSSGIIDWDESSAVGYSGFGDCKNQPLCQDKPDEGPIPQGYYTLVSLIPETPFHGPNVIVLSPDQANQMFGRSGFLIHGDSIVNPGQASQGCIIQALETRLSIWNSGDRRLQVVA